MRQITDTVCEAASRSWSTERFIIDAQSKRWCIREGPLCVLGLCRFVIKLSLPVGRVGIKGTLFIERVGIKGAAVQKEESFKFCRAKLVRAGNCESADPGRRESKSLPAKLFRFQIRYLNSEGGEALFLQREGHCG